MLLTCLFLYHWTPSCIISLPQVHIRPHHSFAQKRVVHLCALLHSSPSEMKGLYLVLDSCYLAPGRLSSSLFFIPFMHPGSQKGTICCSLEILISTSLLTFFPTGEAPSSLSLCSKIRHPPIATRKSLLMKCFPWIPHRKVDSPAKPLCVLAIPPVFLIPHFSLLLNYSRRFLSSPPK